LAGTGALHGAANDAASQVQRSQLQYNGQVTDTKMFATVGLVANMRDVLTGEVKTLGAEAGSSATASRYESFFSSAYTKGIAQGKLIEPNTPVASALAVAAIRLAAEVSEADGKVAWKGRIAAAPDPDGVVLNAGSDAGVRLGDTFRVAHRGQKLTDPANGRTLGWASQPAGTIVVTRVEPAMSTCRVIASDS